ncbi:unnamed protein product [Protopolystoma xenopodis]|uniref:MATH domain-containing protein n=1 Tax=Protopolystoma xenopodis TaxID=117903 RepID=A0A3S5CPD1_9PLAT|nr:unnamed protein product [Protopolystoma xenopodis]
MKTKALAEYKTTLLKMDNRILNMEKLYGASFIWHIEEFSKKLNEAKSGKKTTFFSAPFYTHRYGYRLVLSLCPNGDGSAKGQFVSLYVCFCRGEYDALLTWPFSHQVSRTTFTLVL